MVVWSSLKLLITNGLTKNAPKTILKRPMSDHRVFPLQPSRWQWNKFKDFVHFYIMLGVIPLTAITLYANIFIGPATLSEIPEGYVPKYWEYYRSPVTRFLARYVYTDPQQEYEKYLHFMYEEHEKTRMRQLEAQIKSKMEERADYQTYYYRPITAKYHRIARKNVEDSDSIGGN